MMLPFALPKGAGQLKRWTIALTLSYLFLLSTTLTVFLTVPLLQVPGLGAFASLPITGVFVFLCIASHRRVCRWISDHNGAVCFECGYPGPAEIGDVCPECGRQRSARDIDHVSGVLRNAGSQYAGRGSSEGDRP